MEEEGEEEEEEEEEEEVDDDDAEDETRDTSEIAAATSPWRILDAASEATAREAACEGNGGAGSESYGGCFR